MITRFRSRSHSCLGVFLLIAVLAGCAPPGYHSVKPTSLNQAALEIPENQLLDVGVAISDSPDLTEHEYVKQGTDPDVRTSECHFVPFHMKKTLQLSSHWGSVQVIPPVDEDVDLKIDSTVILSNGEILRLAVEAKDATGRRWLRRKYQVKVRSEDYGGLEQGNHDVYQDLYNTIANDLSAFKGRLTESEVEYIRTVSRLKYARELAPDAFGEYLVENRKGQITVQRLPADHDPLMQRIDRVHEREEMFLDTLNQYYEGVYDRMWEPYENWRRLDRVERMAKRKAEQEAVLRTLTGILLIAGGIAIGAGDSSGDLAGLGAIMVVGGGQVMVSGINISQQVDLHAAAIEELSESLGAEMRPIIVELEGHQYELTGSASEKFEQMKELLRRIYFEETGFDSDSEYGNAPASFVPSGSL